MSTPGVRSEATVDVLAKAWQASAAALAAWAEERLVNRTDAWGLYVRWTDDAGVEHGSMTAPARKQRRQVRLTRLDLENHFRGLPGQIKGAHSTSPENTCKWIGFDFDNHTGAPDLAAKNLDYALALIEHLRAHGFVAFLEDSNGDGGYHVWVLLSAPAPSTTAYAFVHAVLTELGLSAEGFPKQAEIGDGYGNFLRMPGKHHSRQHWSRIYGDGRWLEGDEAITALLNAPINNPALLPAPPAQEELDQTRNINRELSSAPRPGRRSDAQIAVDCLQHLGVDVADDRALWIKIGQILHDVDPALLAEWEGWSKQSSKYKDGECPSKWKGFGRHQGRVATLGTLVYLARRAGANIRFHGVPNDCRRSADAAPARPPMIEGPLQIRLVVIRVTKTPARQNIRCAVHIAGEDTEMELTATDTAAGVRAATKEISDIYAATQDQPLSAEQQSEVSAWLRTILTSKSISRLAEKLEAAKPPPAEPVTPIGPSMHDIALKYTAEELALAFVGPAGGLWSERLGRVFDRNEFTAWLPPQLMSLITSAVDYPEPTPLDPTKPIRHLQLTLRPVWTALSLALPTERYAVLGPTSKAAIAFRQAICRLWQLPETWMKFEAVHGEPGHVERMSLASRVREMAYPAGQRAPRWDRVLKGVNAFYRVEKGEQGPVVWLAMRVDLCHGEIKGAGVEGVATQEDLTVLMARYGLSDTGTITDRLREDGKQQRVCVLSRALCDYLVSCIDPAAEEPPVTDPTSPAVTGSADSVPFDPITGEVLEGEEVTR